MSELFRRWEKVGCELGISIEGPQIVTLNSGAQLSVVMRVPMFGAKNGMLVVTDYKSIKPIEKDILASGYGYSVMSEPSTPDAYDAEGLVRILSDWSWTGPLWERPDWIDETLSSDDP